MADNQITRKQSYRLLSSHSRRERRSSQYEICWINGNQYSIDFSRIKQTTVYEIDL